MIASKKVNFLVLFRPIHFIGIRTMTNMVLLIGVSKSPDLCMWSYALNNVVMVECHSRPETAAEDKPNIV